MELFPEHHMLVCLLREISQSSQCLKVVILLNYSSSEEVISLLLELREFDAHCHFISRYQSS